MLKTTNLQLPTTLTLIQFNPTGDTVTQNIILSNADSLLFIDSLLPNQTYKILAAMQPYNNASSELSVTTMDTTSHDFTFETFTFGGTAGSSSLYDVAIIDENNIWAVGEIYMLDSLGRPDPNAYNAVHWDGTKWELKRVYTYSACSSIDYAPLKSIYAFAENHIVVTSGGGLWWFDGNKWNAECSINPLLTGAINKLWGSSSSDLYAVGNNGNIAHWDGMKWTKIESGTTLNINDIWGDYNEKTQEWEILAVASDFGTSLEKAILQIKNNSVIKLPLSLQMWPLKTVWFVSGKQYYVAGAGIYQKRLLKDSLWKNEALDITTFSTYSIRGNNFNDVVGVGAFGDLIHFNGLNWKNDYEEPNLTYGAYWSARIKDDLVIAVGYDYSQAVITMAKR